MEEAIFVWCSPQVQKVLDQAILLLRAEHCLLSSGSHRKFLLLGDKLHHFHDEVVGGGLRLVRDLVLHIFEVLRLGPIRPVSVLAFVGSKVRGVLRVRLNVRSVFFGLLFEECFALSFLLFPLLLFALVRLVLHLGLPAAATCLLLDLSSLIRCRLLLELRSFLLLLFPLYLLDFF